MMNSPLVTLTLVALCSWLGWTAYVETNRLNPSADGRGRIVGGRSVHGGGETTQSLGKSELDNATIVFPPLETFDEIVARPLFNATRRPEKVEVALPDVMPSELNIMLSGIVIGQTQQIVHLRSTTNKQTQALSVGDKIDDWQILSILPDHIVLQSGDRVETLFIQKLVREGAKSSSRRTTTRSKQRARQNLLRPKRRGE